MNCTIKFDLVIFLPPFFSVHTRVLLNTRGKKTEIACYGEQQTPDEISHSIYNALQFLADSFVRRKFIRFPRVCVCVC